MCAPMLLLAPADALQDSQAAVGAECSTTLSIVRSAATLLHPGALRQL